MSRNQPDSAGETTNDNLSGWVWACGPLLMIAVSSAMGLSGGFHAGASSKPVLSTSTVGQDSTVSGASTVPPADPVQFSSPSAFRPVALLTVKAEADAVVRNPEIVTHPSPTLSLGAKAESPIERAMRTISECQARFNGVKDYSCTFYKRERIEGQMTPLSVMSMKARTTPRSIYFRFAQPFTGREVIYVEGRNGGRVMAHEAGLLKLVAGTLELDPNCPQAMAGCRHPITDAGIGALLDTVSRRWSSELSPDDSQIHFQSEEVLSDRRCLLVESIHPHKKPEFMFHKVRLFIDRHLNLPIRFEAYDWPKHKGGEPELVEEYAYMDLKINVGLSENDFDPANESYSFGRF